MTSAAATAAPGLQRSAGELAPDVVEEIERSRARPPVRLPARERLAAIGLTAAFLAGAGAAAALLDSERAFSPLAAVFLIAAYAVTARAAFEVRTGLVLPTQLVLVPMLFALPLGAVPLCVAAGLLASRAPEIATRKLSLDRALVLIVNAAHSLGPVLVLGLAGEQAGWGRWPVYVAALAAQFGFDFASAATWDWLALGVRPTAQIRYMWVAYAVDCTLAPVGLAAALATGGHPLTALIALPLVGLLTVFAQERRARIDNALELSQAYRGTAFLLGDVVEADDAYTGSHSRDVVELALNVADRLHVRPRDRVLVEFAALLHDVGKIRIANAIINKPSPLTPEERAIVEMHTVEGERMLARVGGMLGDVGRIVRSCHERHDGGGYPDGLAGDAIPLVSRIVACCDAYSAITTDRPYRRSRTPHEAAEELRRERGRQFDPAVVDALLAELGLQRP